MSAGKNQYPSLPAAAENGPEMESMKHPLEKQKTENVRAEIDTSAPFESVKEAATRFGGIGFWRPTSYKLSVPADNAFIEPELVDITKLEEEAAQLEKDLILKELETLDVLKELESTKLIVEELKLKVQKQVITDLNLSPIPEVVEKESHGNLIPAVHCPSSDPSSILLELKQAKLNLTKTTTDLMDIRSTVESYKQKIEKERISLEKTRQRLSSNVAKASSLEKELTEKRQKLDNDPIAISQELHRLSSETDEFKKMGELARSEIVKAMSEIEETKTRLKTAEIRLVAAKKMKEAAQASEAFTQAEIKAISISNNEKISSSESITLTFEEYTDLVSKAREAEESSKLKVINGNLQVDEANVSKTEILRKVEEATEEVITSKKALEEALGRVEAANKEKVAVEEALRIWRSERGQKRRSTIHNNTKFKVSSARGKDSTLLDVNGVNLVNDGEDEDEEIKPVLKSTLSIGQILSRKLLLTEEYESGMQGGKRKVSLSLGQMLGKLSGELETVSNKGGEDKENNNPKRKSSKRKKFGFAKISSLVTKQSKKKKKRTTSSSSMCGNV